jgi:hypothetical protein
VAAHIRNKLINGMEDDKDPNPPETADDVEQSAGRIDIKTSPIPNILEARRYFRRAGLMMDGRLVSIHNAPAGHYAVFLRQGAKEGLHHVIYGEVPEGQRSMRLYDPQIGKVRVWVDLQALLEPYGVSEVEE